MHKGGTLFTRTAELLTLCVASAKFGLHPSNVNFSTQSEELITTRTGMHVHIYIIGHVH